MKGKVKYNKSTSEELMCMFKTWACGPEGSMDGKSTGTTAGGNACKATDRGTSTELWVVLLIAGGNKENMQIHMCMQISLSSKGLWE